MPVARWSALGIYKKSKKAPAITGFRVLAFKGCSVLQPFSNPPGKPYTSCGLLTTGPGAARDYISASWGELPFCCCLKVNSIQFNIIGFFCFACNYRYCIVATSQMIKGDNHNLV